jgi:hypothetical protein
VATVQNIENAIGEHHWSQLAQSLYPQEGFGHNADFVGKTHGLAHGLRLRQR